MRELFRPVFSSSSEQRVGSGWKCTLFIYPSCDLVGAFFLDLVSKEVFSLFFRSGRLLSHGGGCFFLCGNSTQIRTSVIPWEGAFFLKMTVAILFRFLPFRKFIFLKISNKCVTLQQ